MTDFKERRYDILVSTVIIEVGIDAKRYRNGCRACGTVRTCPTPPTARDALAGEASSHTACFLEIPKPMRARERLKIMTKTCDGFKIAEMDFKLRGPGEFFGTRQHGLPELKISDLIRDFPILNKPALTHLKSYPETRISHQRHIKK